MPENEVPAPKNRPRLLSDILEIPLSESAIPEEYTMQRPSAFPAPQLASPQHVRQASLDHRRSSAFQQPLRINDPVLTPARNPGVIGQPPQRASPGGPQSQVGHFHPCTPIAPPSPSVYYEKRRSTPSPLPIFTTSPAVSEPGSPSHAQIPALGRSFSQTSLYNCRTPSRPRTPTPASIRSNEKARVLPRSSSLPTSPKYRRTTPHPHGKPSVKHLTCFWWKVKGDCRFSEENCLYAHRETGLLADAPRQVIPGEPAKAGRHLEKALEDIRFKRNLSSSSLATSMVANPSTPESHGPSSRDTSPNDAEALQQQISSLQSDNDFLRNLVEQGSKEKSILMSTIEGLQKENLNLNKDVDFLKDVVDQLQRQRQRGSSESRVSGGVSTETKEDLQHGREL